MAFGSVGRRQQEGNGYKAGEAYAAQHDEGQPPAALLAEPRAKWHADHHSKRTAPDHPCDDLRPHPGREEPDGCARAARGWWSYKTSLVEGPAPNVRPSVVWSLPTTPPAWLLSTLIARLLPGG